MPQPITREAFTEILKTRCIEFTREEIRDLMNEEFEKDPDEMDLKLVDLCLDALDGKFDYLKEESKTMSKKYIERETLFYTK